MSDEDDTIEQARRLCGQKSWSRNRLAREAGLGKNSLNNLFLPSYNPRIETVRRIRAVLNTVRADGDSRSRSGPD
jgi:transcriptional regulator with XRE-family HTH domain